MINDKELEFWNDYCLLFKDVDNLGNFIFFDKKYKWLLIKTDYSMFITITKDGEIFLEN